MVRIDGIQRKLQTERRNKFLFRLEKELQDELAHILKTEELMWFQRSRAKWLVDGDRNTRYYHLKAITRRRYNKINMLRDTQGNWIENVDALKQMANDYYKVLFSANGSVVNWYQTAVTFPRLHEDDLQVIRGDITNAEVKEAVFNMSPWKAPGLDGFPAGFYQKSWDIVGQSVCEFVKRVWSNPFGVRDINCTDICLIPKVDQPETIQQFRPISLCNTLYKVVSKVMTNRIKDTINKVVSPHQTGFIPGRSIHENIVVAQEMAHSMRQLNGKVGYPTKWIDVVMTSVTSVRTNVKWNGERAEYFHPQQGIRQGDPISPYLFVICVDKLSHLITQGVHEGEWKPMRAGRNGPLISHLMFADDLILFAEANSSQMSVVLKILDQFCQLSGQQVSHEKTSIMFSKNVSSKIREELVMQSGFNETPSLGKYLGVPLVGRAPKRSDFNYLIDQVKNKLSAWKAKQLSFAGRVTLSKSVIEAIPIYPMMTTPIPKACLNEIQKIHRAFIWGDEEGNRKYHAVRWDVVTKPKVFGGLGIRRLVHMNKACLMKLGWAIRSGKNALWIDVVKGKYDRQNSNFETPLVRAQDSSLWKSLYDALHSFHMYEFWVLGNGNSVNAWSDKWLVHGKSIEEMGFVIPDALQNWKVKDLVDTNGFWNLEILSTWLPHNIVSKLFSIVPPNNNSAADIRAWSGSADGDFNIASAYTRLCQFSDEEWDVGWLNIWKLQVPERVRSFIWLVRHDRLITNYRKSKMRLCDPWCNHCVDIVEDTMHVLRDCPLAKGVWCNLLNGAARDSFYAANREDWMKLNTSQDLGKVSANSWSCVWAVGCHFLWLWRNREAHGDERKGVIQVGWNHPEGDWIMLNTDGASRRSDLAGCGGLLRNSNGQWLGGFSHHLGCCNSYLAELWGVLDGLTFAFDRGHKKIELHTDSCVVVQTLQSGREGSVVGWRLIQQIRRMLAMDWEVRICHSYREANYCADALANMGCEHESGKRVYEQCRVRLSSLLLADVMGITTPRVISL
ncbi:putative non-LTR retroelement reverse transcriptase [Trifolium medium]|uniref:Putative non-LTR retroelement reverse transcriptase n=1 Tax=Trifolium medium TaxID=97028 RepID=A0A392LX77_9FABA|nr:putative non-LTR retroelement reverse transcriptase [Trifolium medium]